MTPPELTALLDANVLYPARLRDLLIGLAGAGAYRGRWTNSIHDEWTRNVLANRPDLTRERLERTRALMDAAVLDCLVEDYEPLARTLHLPDEHDRHVLAAAITTHANMIVTMNLRDFPNATLEPHGIEAVHPDEFILRLITDSPHRVLDTVREQRARLRKPPITVEDWLEGLQTLGLKRTTAELTRHAQHL